MDPSKRLERSLPDQKTILMGLLGIRLSRQSSAPISASLSSRPLSEKKVGLECDSESFGDESQTPCTVTYISDMLLPFAD